MSENAHRAVNSIELFSEFNLASLFIECKTILDNMIDSEIRKFGFVIKLFDLL